MAALKRMIPTQAARGKPMVASQERLMDTKAMLRLRRVVDGIRLTSGSMASTSEGYMSNSGLWLDGPRLGRSWELQRKLSKRVDSSNPYSFYSNALSQGKLYN